MKHEFGQLPHDVLDLSRQQLHSLADEVSQSGHFGPIVVADDREIGKLRLLYGKHVDGGDSLEPRYSFGEEFDVVVLLDDVSVLRLESLLFRSH